MKLLCGFMVVLIFQQATARIIRKPPAFSTPVYSNSYLPAVMQVIFHSVEQLKVLQEEEASHDSSTIASSTIHSMKHQQTYLATTISISTTTTAEDESTEVPRSSSTSSATIRVTSNDSPENYDDLAEIAQSVVTSTTSISVALDGGHEESPEVNEETTEMNYATPETNHESPEPVQEFQESNQEVSEGSDEKSSSTAKVPDDETSQQAEGSQRQPTHVPSEAAEQLHGQKKKEPTVDSVVSEVYGIVNPTTKLTPPSIEESSVTDEAKSAMENRDPIEKMENNEDEEEDTRFTLLGEKVAQVPRPSLSSYLRRAKVPPRRSLQQLASLYDALSKDARKQGFARFAGYSDEVLKALHSSAEGGVGPQLKQLLERMIKRSELTRDDAKMRTSEALRDLDDPASALNNDLRRVLPLRYAA